MEGHLNVLSTDGKSWKKRYCSLKNRILFIFESKLKSDETSNQYQILYFVPLARCGHIATAVNDGPNGKHFCFKVSYELDESTHYWLSAENEQEMNQWVNILQDSCAVKKEPEKVQVKGRSKSVVFKPGALQIAGISDHSGWLKKCSTSGGFRKTIQWKKRWIVLKDLVLYVYEGPESKLKTKVSIPNWKISVDENIGGFCFTLSHMGYEGITLQADSAEERTKWIQRIKESNRSLTTTLPSDRDEERIREWIKSLTTLHIQQPLEFLTNASFLVNIIGKASSQTIRIALEATDTRKENDEWNRKSFEVILKTLAMQGCTFVQEYLVEDFLNANPIVLKFALQLLNHFSPLFMNTPPVSAVATPSVSACSTMTSPTTLTPRSEASSITSSSSSSVTKEQEEIDSQASVVVVVEKEQISTPVKQPPSPVKQQQQQEPVVSPIKQQPTTTTTTTNTPIKQQQQPQQQEPVVSPIKKIEEPVSTPIKPTEPIKSTQQQPEVSPIKVVVPPPPVVSAAPTPQPPPPQKEKSLEELTTEEILESINKLSESQNYNLEEEIANLSQSINLNASINLNSSINNNNNNNNNNDHDEHDESTDTIPTTTTVPTPTITTTPTKTTNNITPVSTPTKHNQSSYVVSPYRNLKRVETKDVIGEFDRIFSSLGKTYPKCNRCNEPITGVDIIEISGKSWHLDHFNCCTCHKVLMGIDQIPFVEREGKIYCKDDHDKLFKESNCSQCSKSLLITFAHKGKLLCKEHYMSQPEIQSNICQNCEEPIGNAPFQILDTKKWHVEHFKCSYCKVQLHDAANCSVKNSLPYCKKCHISLF